MYIIVVLCVCLYLWWWNKARKIVYPPMYPGYLPLIGHTHQLIMNKDNQKLSKLMYSLADTSNKEGGVILCKLGWQNYYIITDPDDFATASQHVLKKHFAYSFLKAWLGNGLISGSDLSIWRRHRKLLSPAFSQVVIDGFITIFNTHSKLMVKELEQEVGKGPFQHAEYLDKMTLEAICETAFGINIYDTKVFNTSNYLNNMKGMLHIIIERFSKLYSQSDLLYSFTELKRTEDQVIKTLNEMSETVLATKRNNSFQNNNSNGKKFKAFLDLALELSEKGLLSDKEVWEEMNTMILAGYETSGNTLMYTLMLVGSHPNVQNKIFEELQSVFGESLRDVQKQDLSKLAYLEAVIKESLRVYSITPVMLRHVDYDLQLKNYTIPAGSSCLLFTCGLHRHPIWGDDVMEFKPERWLDPVAISDPNAAIHKAFAGFGSGKRLCLGKTYAMMSMKTIMAHVLRNYKIHADITKLVLKVDPLLRPAAGDVISIERRALDLKNSKN